MGSPMMELRAKQRWLIQTFGIVPAGVIQDEQTAFVLWLKTYFSLVQDTRRIRLFR